MTLLCLWKESCYRTLSLLKICPQPRLNPQTLGPTESTLPTRPPRAINVRKVGKLVLSRTSCLYVCHSHFTSQLKDKPSWQQTDQNKYSKSQWYSVYHLKRNSITIMYNSIKIKSEAGPSPYNRLSQPLQWHLYQVYPCCKAVAHASCERAVHMQTCIHMQNVCSISNITSQ
jgi:hypothetical protein